ncbi:hypothetical protein CP061683_0304B, partial [Chlamydia psittaci 06-1683]
FREPHPYTRCDQLLSVISPVQKGWIRT